MHSLGIIPASPVTTLAKGATVARAEYAREAAGRWRPLATIARSITVFFFGFLTGGAVVFFGSRVVAMLALVYFTNKRQR